MNKTPCLPENLQNIYNELVQLGLQVTIDNYSMLKVRTNVASSHRTIRISRGFRKWIVSNSSTADCFMTSTYFRDENSVVPFVLQCHEYNNVQAQIDEINEAFSAKDDE